MNTEHLCAANSNGTLTFWKIAHLSAEQKVGMKRQKTNIPVIAPHKEHAVSGHELNGLKWTREDLVIVGGQDHTIRLYDVGREGVAETLVTNYKAINCLDARRDTVISGHEDSMVRMWDIRA